MPASVPWWLDFYEELTARFILTRTDPVAERRLGEFLVRELRLRPGDAVFDQGCGTGEVSLLLGRLGHRVIGVDACEPYILQAQRAAAAEGLPCGFFVGDAAEFVVPQPCRGAVNWWTSFGHAPTRDDNLRLLRRVFESLENGGRFLLEFPNALCIHKHFSPVLVQRYAAPEGEYVLLRECRFEPAAGLMHQDWTWIRPDGTRRTRSGVLRLFTPAELTDMLHETGFRGIDVSAGPDAGPLTLDSPRCLLVAEKPLDFVS